MHVVVTGTILSSMPLRCASIVSHGAQCGDALRPSSAGGHTPARASRAAGSRPGVVYPPGVVPGLNVGMAQYLRDLPRGAYMRVHHAVDERRGLGVGR